MALTQNQIQDILGRVPTADETSKYSNASLADVLAYKNTSKQSQTTPQNTQTTPVSYGASLPTQTQQPDQSTQPISQAKQEHDQALSSYQNIQKQVSEIDKTLNDSFINKKKEIEAQGGVVNETQLRAQIANEQAPLLAQRKTLAQSQAIAGQELSRTQAAYSAESNRAISLARLAQSGEQFQQKQAQQAGQFEQKQSTADILAQARLAQQVNMNLTSDQISAIGESIISGKMSPIITGYSRSAPQIKAYLASKGFDVAKAEQDYKATAKYLATLNGAQMIKQQQAVNFVKETIPNVRDAVNTWNTQVGAGAYPILNKANLLAAKNGVYGTEAQVAATQLDTWITDMASELSTVYKGGNSPTDATLAQANKTLSTDWSFDSLNAALDTIDKTTDLRLQAINDLHPYGVSGDYAPEKDKSKPTEKTTAKEGESVDIGGSSFSYKNGKWVAK